VEPSNTARPPASTSNFGEAIPLDLRAELERRRYAPERIGVAGDGLTRDVRRRDPAGLAIDDDRARRKRVARVELFAAHAERLDGSFAEAHLDFGLEDPSVEGHARDEPLSARAEQGHAPARRRR
jgi:hypothetical protein